MISSRWIFLATLVLFASPAASAQNISEQYLLAAANNERALHHLPPVSVDPGLFRAALQHARQMAAREDISHQFPNEPDLASRVAAAGAHFSLVTENVAEASNSFKIHELWMQSRGHRDNLLDPQVDRVGIAVVQRAAQLYAVEDFARGVERLTLQQQEQAVMRLLGSYGFQVAAGSDDARATCALTTGFSGQHRPGFVMRYTSADLHRLPDQLVAKLDSGKYHLATVGACSLEDRSPFTAYNFAVLLFP